MIDTLEEHALWKIHVRIMQQFRNYRPTQLYRSRRHSDGEGCTTLRAAMLCRGVSLLPVSCTSNRTEKHQWFRPFGSQGALYLSSLPCSCAYIALGKPRIHRLFISSTPFPTAKFELRFRARCKVYFLPSLRIKLTSDTAVFALRAAVGPGVQDLDLRHVHTCADTEESWPIQDRSRFCVSLAELVRRECVSCFPTRNVNMLWSLRAILHRGPDRAGTTLQGCGGRDDPKAHAHAFREPCWYGHLARNPQSWVEIKLEKLGGAQSGNVPQSPAAPPTGTMYLILPLAAENKLETTPTQASSDSQSSLVFGSTIGVVEGSVSLRDARPGCFPAGSLRGGVLPMAEGLDGHQPRLASTSMRFKVIWGR